MVSGVDVMFVRQPLPKGHLAGMGWWVLVIWECETTSPDRLAEVVHEVLRLAFCVRSTRRSAGPPIPVSMAIEDVAGRIMWRAVRITSKMAHSRTGPRGGSAATGAGAGPGRG